jgi:hypothetical protein
LVDELNHWTCSSNGAIKICVSSREENAFQTGFPANRRIRMQDLTKSDMEAYVWGMLEKWDHMRARSDIVDRIVDHSDGIFLWVVLVVKRLRECLVNEENLEKFYQELQHLPRELEPLFDHLMESIRKDGRTKKAWQLFQLVMSFSECTYKVPIVSYLFLDCFETDSNFAVEWSEQRLQESLYHCQNKGTPSRERLEDRAQKLIQAWCKGLVETRELTKESYPDGMPTESAVRYDAQYRNKYALFTHRSIPEFLESRKTAVEVKELERSSAGALSQLLLATLKCTTRHYIPHVWWASLIGVVVGVHRRLGQDTAAVRFLMHLEAEVHNYLPLCDPPIPDNMVIHSSGLIRTGEFQHTLLALYIRRDSLILQHPPSQSVVPSPVAILAASWDPEHIDHILTQDPTLLETEARRSLLLAFLVGRVLFRLSLKADKVSNLADCVERKLLARPIPRQVNTLWSNIVLEYVASGSRPREEYPDHLDRAGMMIAAFLRAYRKPLLSTTISHVSIPKGEQEFEVRMGPPQRVKSIYLAELQDNGDEQFSAVRQDIHKDGMLMQSVAPNTHPFAPPDTTWTLRSLIERFDFRKRNEVLRLMDEIEGVPYTVSSLSCYTTTTCGEEGCKNPDHTVPWYPPGTVDPNATTEGIDDNPKLEPEPLEHGTPLSRVLTYTNLLRISPLLRMLSTHPR